MIINQLESKPFLSNVNDIITLYNPYLTTKLTPYTSETEVAKMFATADSSGEASLTPRDKIILRAVSYLGYSVQQACGWGYFPTVCDIGEDGKVSWADDILKQKGQTLIQNMVQVFKAAFSFGANSDAIDDETFLNIITPIIPKTLSPFTGKADYLAKMESNDPTAMWFKKFFMIGPLYLYWKAIHIWKLDPAFSVSVTSTSASLAPPPP